MLHPCFFLDGLSMSEERKNIAHEEKISPVFLSSHRSFLCGGTEKGQPFFSAALNGYLFHFGLYGPAPREESFIGGFSMYSFSDEESPISKKIFLYVLLRNAGG